MISERLTEAINQQINAEMWSAYLYLSMSQDLYKKGFKGIAHWYKVQFLEEQAHAAIFINYLHSQDAKVILAPIAEVQTEWDSVLAIFEDTWAHEKRVTAMINNLCDIAEDEHDRAAQNDANAGALAEWEFGAGRGCGNMIFITFGTGCGAGLILDGRLYSGTNDNAGECGHIRLTDFGPVGYGKAGSMEGYCSGGGIAQLGQTYLYELVQQGVKSELCDLYRSGTEITAKLLAEYARKGDETAKRVFRVSAEMLGRSLSVLIDILNPERIIIGGVFARCTDLLLEGCENIIRQEALSPAASVCRVLPAGLGEQIGDYAALAVAAYLSDSTASI